VIVDLKTEVISLAVVLYGVENVLI